MICLSFGIALAKHQSWWTVGLCIQHAHNNFYQFIARLWHRECAIFAPCLSLMACRNGLSCHSSFIHSPLLTLFMVHRLKTTLSLFFAKYRQRHAYYSCPVFFGTAISAHPLRVQCRDACELNEVMWGNPKKFWVCEFDGEIWEK